MSFENPSTTLSSNGNQSELCTKDNIIFFQPLIDNDTFFTCVTKYFEAFKPEMELTEKSLRLLCKKFAQNESKKADSWLNNILQEHNENIEEYVHHIEFTESDIQQNDGAVQLTSSIRGRPEIEGRIICNEYNVTLYFIEENSICLESVKLKSKRVDKNGCTIIDETGNITNIYRFYFEFLIQEFTINPIKKNPFYNKLTLDNSNLHSNLIGCQFKNRNSVQELDDILSKTYNELNMKNVPLSGYIHQALPFRLIQLKFCYDKNNNPNTKLSPEIFKNEIEERMKMVIQNIDDLLNTYKGQKVDIKFIFISTFIAKSLHVLKNLLKPTYKNLPWEEMEFCLVAFISSQTKLQEINLFYNAVLYKNRLLNHLENFKKSLMKLEIQDEDIKGKIPNGKRTQIINKILSRNKNFELLYTDYGQIKNVYSLERIKYYLQLALSYDKEECLNQIIKKRAPQQTEESLKDLTSSLRHLITERALQAAGEFLKNTLESPHLTDDASELLNVTLHEDTKQIIEELRDRLSHTFISSHNNQQFLFPKREEFRKSPPDLQNDLKKIFNAIDYISYNIKAGIIWTIIEKISEANDINQVKQFRKILNHTFVKKFKESQKVEELGNIGELVKELKNDMIGHEEYDVKELFKEIEENIKTEEDQTDYKIFYRNHYCELLYLLAYIERETRIERIQFESRLILRKLKPVLKLQNFEMIIASLKLLYKRVELKPNFSNWDNKFWGIYHNTELVGKINSITQYHDELKIEVEENRIENEINRIFVDIKEKSEETFNKLNETKEANEKLAYFTKEFKKELKTQNETQTIYDKYKSKFKEILDNLNIKANDKEKIIKCYEKSEWNKCENSLKNFARNYNSFRTDIKKFVQDRDFEKISDSILKKLCKDFNLEVRNTVKEILKGMLEEENKKLEKNFHERLEILKKITKIGLIYDKSDIIISALEILVLDILTYLQEKVGCVDSNRYGAVSSVDRCVPFLIGASLRNHLAHGNALDSILQSNPATSLITNAIGLSRKANGLIEKSNTLILAAHPMITIKSLKEQYDANLKLIHNQQKMLMAAKIGDINKLEECLQKGADILARDIDGSNILHYAAANDSLSILQYHCVALSCQNLIHGVNLQGVKPLHIAAEFGSKNILHYCLEKNFLNIFNYFDEGNRTLLHYAVKGVQEKIVEILLKSVAPDKIGEFINMKADFGFTCLHVIAGDRFHDFHHFSLREYFIQNDNTSLDILDKLIQQGGNINIKTEVGLIPLQYAVGSGRKQIVENLLGKKYANVSIPIENFELLRLATINGHTEIVKVLLQTSGLNVNNKDHEGFTPLHLAAGNGYEDIVEILLQNPSIKINCETEEGYIAVHFAAFIGHEGIVQKLLSFKNLAASDKTRTGDTSLCLPKENDCKDIINNIPSTKATHINDQTKDGMTPLHLAAIGGHAGIVKIILLNALGMKTNEENLNYTKNEDKKITSLLHQVINAKNNENLTPVHLAAQNGHSEIVEILLRMNNEGINNKTKDGFTPLHLAAQNGHENVVCALIKRNDIKVNVLDNDKLSPLHYAAYNCHANVVKALLEVRDIEIDIKGKYNSSPIYLAVQSGCKHIVELLLAKYKEKNIDMNPADEDGFTLLHFAAINGQEDITKILLEEGADVNCKTKEHHTPLHYAAIKGQTRVINVLLSKQDINLNNNGVLAPLHLASLMGYKSAVEALLKAKNIEVDIRDENNWSALHVAAFGGYNDIVKILLKKYKEKGIDINIEDDERFTPLHIAVRNGHTNVINTLLRHTEINSKSKDNTSSLHYAKQGRKDIVKALLQIDDIKVDVRNKRGLSPLHIAAGNGNKYILEILLAKYKEEGISIDPQDECGFTPLHLAAQHGYEDVTKFLLSEGANINCKTKDGSVLLHLAAAVGLQNVIKILLEKPDVDVNIKNTNQLSPLHFAAQNAHQNVIETLLEVNDIDVDTRDRLNRSPLHIAAQFGYNYIVEILVAKYKEKDIDIDEQAEGGITPLHLASLNGHEDVTQFLLTNGANFECKATGFQVLLYLLSTIDFENVTKMLFGNNNELSPFQLFTALKGLNNVVEAIKYIVTDIKNKHGMSPLHLAATCGHIKTVEILVAKYKEKGIDIDPQTNDIMHLRLASLNGHE